MMRIGGHDRALFASDVHLDDRHPATARHFFDALAHASSDTTHLFLLGDLFEYWVGDDQPGATVDAAIALLHALSAGGVAVYVMRGNRDFLLDRGTPAHAGIGFAARTGAQMLPDPTVVELFGTSTLLLHGDTLCTADLAYQNFRELARTTRWQDAFLHHSLAERIEQARELREQSERSKAGKRAEWMNVTPEAVSAAALASGVHTLIHGHTHRPACHRTPTHAGELVRWVLPDWYAPDEAADPDSDPSQRGGFLQVSAQGWERIGVWPALSSAEALAGITPARQS